MLPIATSAGAGDGLAPVARCRAMASPKGAREDAAAAILVVDDDADVRLALEMLLQYEGFEVWTARDGEEALARLERDGIV